MNRHDRTTLFRLRTLFNDGERLGYDDIARRLEISDRQARRHVARLQAEGVELAREREGRRWIFHLPEEHREHGLRVALAEEQIVALAVAADAVRSSLG